MISKAFTLIELLVVVAIIGILAAVGLTTYNGIQNNAKASTTLKSLHTVEKFITKISRSLEELGQSEISSSIIGTMVMDGLKEIDPVAYVRFASVYRNFREEKDFVQFVDKINVIKNK